MFVLVYVGLIAHYGDRERHWTLDAYSGISHSNKAKNAKTPVFEGF